MRGQRRRGVIIAAGLLGALGCSSSTGALSETSAPLGVEVLSWWASRGETDALNAAIAVFHGNRPDVAVSESLVTGSTTAKEQLQRRFWKGAPPDLFQVNGGQDLCAWVIPTQNYVESMDSVAIRYGWTDPAVMPAAVQNSARCVGPDQVAHFYGVPLDIHRNNTLFYNRKVLADNGIGALPKTVQEFFGVADQLKQAGVVPLALGTSPAKGGAWPLALLLFETLLPAIKGADYYTAFFSGRGNPEDGNLRDVLTTAARLLDYVNPDARDLGWDEAAELVHTGRAAMMVMGDWARGYYVAEGWSGGETGFGARAAFGDAFVMTTDVLGLAVGARNRGAALALLEAFGSTEGLDAFNVVKGSIPPRMGQLDPQKYDMYSQQTVAEFVAAAGGSSPTAKLVPALALLAPVDYIRAIEAALGVFQVDRNVENLLLAMKNEYAKLAPP